MIETEAYKTGYSDGYKDGNRDKNERLTETIRQIHDGVFAEATRRERERITELIVNDSFFLDKFEKQYILGLINN